MWKTYRCDDPAFFIRPSSLSMFVVLVLLYLGALASVACFVVCCAAAATTTTTTEVKVETLKKRSRLRAREPPVRVTNATRVRVICIHNIMCVVCFDITLGLWRCSRRCSCDAARPMCVGLQRQKCARRKTTHTHNQNPQNARHWCQQ